MIDKLVELIRSGIGFCYDLGASVGIANYGFAIILFTAVIKIALYPLAAKQIASTKAMQEIQPRMKVLQEKYKNDKARLQEETLKLYKETGFNPLAGCLPLLAQMPILMGIFWALNDFPYQNPPPSFFWIADLSQKASDIVRPAVLSDLTKSDIGLMLLPILSALTTLYQTYQTMPSSGGQQNKAMLYFMPLFIGYISFSFPAGLVLYWIVTNSLQIAQQSWHNYKDKKIAT